MNNWTAIMAHSLGHWQWAGALLDAAIKSFVVLLFAGGICLCWRRGSASGRHLVWVLAVAALLGLPAFSHLMPGWQRPLWTVGTRAASQNELALILEFMPGRVPATSSSPTAGPPPAAPPADHSVASSAAQPRVGTPFRALWAGLVIAGWLGGAMTVLLWVAVGSLRLRGLRRAAGPPPSEEWAALLRRLQDELQFRRQVTLLWSTQNLMPVTWGWWRPVILLPARADAWPLERRRVVLLHELAHVKRRDCLTQMLARLACAVYWFNPLVWMAARRMCIERERACDDLVLNGGCRASDYAAHLVEIARSFRRMPQVAAIAMARSTHLEGRIAAIVDASRVRRGPRALLTAACCLAMLGFVAAVAAQKEASNPAKPWFDSRLRAFFAAKEAQAHQLAKQETNALPPELWPYFQAGQSGDWQTATNLWVEMRRRRDQGYGRASSKAPPPCFTPVWSTVLEIDLAWEQFANWKEKYVLAYGDDIIKSIPPGSIYFGGTDPGRGVITAMSDSHARGRPFFTLTQNQLADNTYLEYLRAMYGSTIFTPAEDDSRRCFQEYIADVQRRLAEGKLKPGEDVKVRDEQVQVSGQVAVMAINGSIAKVIFDHNPDRDFYVEESFPLDWMYPHLTPHGLIMKLNRQPLATLPQEVLRQDHEYWSSYLRPLLGEWPQDGASVAELTAFVEKVYLKHDLRGFTGDPEFIQDLWARKAFSKLRSSIGGVYAWRLDPATPPGPGRALGDLFFGVYAWRPDPATPPEYRAESPEEKRQVAKAAEFAFGQAYAICPESPEALFRYTQLLLRLDRRDEARLLAETALKFSPQDPAIQSLVMDVQRLASKPQAAPGP